MDLELVLSPDVSLHRDRAILGAIRSCKREVLVTQNSIPLYWGRGRTNKPYYRPNLPMQALLGAARRGCRVRVLLDSTWYNIRPSDPKDNDNTVRYLSSIAKREKLDLQAKLVNLSSAGLSKIHAKGVVVDRRTVFVGSINWSENSFKGNREVGILIGHPAVARYYAGLFRRDWVFTRLYRIRTKARRTPVRAMPVRSAPVLRWYGKGDLVDVLGRSGEFYQVRLNELRTGFLHKRWVSGKVMTAYESRFQIGETGEVIGRVLSIRRYPKLTRMRVGGSWLGALRVVIFQQDRALFRKKGIVPRKTWRRRFVRILGKITTYKRMPQVVVRRPSQVVVVH